MNFTNRTIAQLVFDDRPEALAELANRADRANTTVELLQLGTARSCRQLDPLDDGFRPIVQRRFQLVTDELNMTVEVTGARTEDFVAIRPVFAMHVLHCPDFVRFDALKEIK